VLALTGIYVDSVIKIGDESLGPPVAAIGSVDLDKVPSLGDVLPSWKHVVGLLSDKVEGSRLEAFWRTILADQGIEDFDING
jgi:hypothetical protein